MMKFNELFGTNEMNANVNARSLPGTAELTALATNEAHRILKVMESDIEGWRPRIQKSSVDARELDAILDEMKPFEVPEENIIRHLDMGTVEAMLKSQQSKRSRTKSKAMTLDNYITLLTAAIAEEILRDVYNKPKSAGGFHRAAGAVDYTGAQLEALAEDQEALRKEIRNIQSKKSIMKSKADFNEADPRWMSLLKAEQQLKDLRVGGRATHVVEVDRTRDALSELLAGKDISKMKSAEAHEVLEAITKMISGEATDESIAEEIQ